MARLYTEEGLLMLTDSKEKLLLVGDNPFHSISHLSQERARGRTEDPGNPKYAASLILTALENGSNGFTFSVSETTLAILKELDAHGAIDRQPASCRNPTAAPG